MFGLFSKKSPREKLLAQHKKLLKEAHSLSSVNRKLSDDKIYEADLLIKKIEQLDKES